MIWIFLKNTNSTSRTQQYIAKFSSGKEYLLSKEDTENNNSKLHIMSVCRTNGRERNLLKTLVYPTWGFLVTWVIVASSQLYGDSTQKSQGRTSLVMMLKNNSAAGKTVYHVAAPMKDHSELSEGPKGTMNKYMNMFFNDKPIESRSTLQELKKSKERIQSSTPKKNTNFEQEKTNKIQAQVRRSAWNRNLKYSFTKEAGIEKKFADANRNTFDELVDLLSPPKVFCRVRVSSTDNASKITFNPQSSKTNYGRENIEAQYVFHCSEHKHSYCEAFKETNQMSKYCENFFAKKGFKVNSVTVKKALRKKENAIEINKVNPLHASNWRDATDIHVTRDPGSEITRHTLTVDANFTFLHQIARIKYAHGMRVDFIIDLMGLNSLHKHEIISKLLQVLRWFLINKGYQIIRCSMDKADLQQYLYQENLQSPRKVLTLWELRRSRSPTRS